jgi:hypothetical protein
MQVSNFDRALGSQKVAKTSGKRIINQELNQAQFLYAGV